ncbi:HNH endonuclease [Eoetvoesiella caeni]|nr:HNH endonuclease [Eoetvoesiella caeni]
MFGPINSARPSASAWASIRTRIFKRDDYTCTYCGTRGGRLECDHIVPIAKGGGHDGSNLTTSCFRCNRSKHSKSLAEWRSLWPAIG